MHWLVRSDQAELVRPLVVVSAEFSRVLGEVRALLGVAETSLTRLLAGRPILTLPQSR